MQKFSQGIYGHIIISYTRMPPYVFYERCALRYSNKTSSDTYGFKDIPLAEKRIGANRTRPCRPLCSPPPSSVLLKATADYAATKSPRRFGTGVQHSPTIFGIAIGRSCSAVKERMI